MWHPPENAPCRVCPDPEIFIPERLTRTAILSPLMDYCRFCPDQSGCFAEGVRLRAWGVWGGIGLTDGKPVRQPSRQMKDNYAKTHTKGESEMTRHPARFRPEEREGIGAAIRFCIAEAHRIRREADNAPTVETVRQGHFEATVIDLLASRMKSLL